MACAGCGKNLDDLLRGLVGYALPPETRPPYDPDVPTYQGWWYVMGSVNQGPFWHWSSVGKMAAQQNAARYGHQAILWRYIPGSGSWARALWYNNGVDGPYLDNV